MATMRTAKGFIMRHRVELRDLLFIAVGTLAALAVVYKVDVFPNAPSVGRRDDVIELDEALLVATLLGLALFGFAIKQYWLQRRETARRIAAEQHARELAYQDGVTGLPNRRQFDEALGTAVSAPPRAGAAHAVFLLDLNGFKRINDVHGHGIGDAVLVVVGQRLLAATRSRDGELVARFGGDEFAVLATHVAGPEAATHVAMRVIEALSEPISAGGVLHEVGAGIGIALVPQDAATATEAVRKADIALYRAKAEKRSALRFFEPAMDSRVHERAALEQALRSAIDADAIEPVFLPTIRLDTQEVVGFEMTPRWVGTDGQSVPVERFLAIAEEIGLIHVLAEKVLRRACAAARAWPAGATLSTDLSAAQLRDELLPARIGRVLAETGLPADRLELEITERALVADPERARAALGLLRAGGIRVVLDHFGTGYSNLSHLRDLRVDKIKIDRSFVEALGTDAGSSGVVGALAGLGRGFGFSVAAEGVDGRERGIGAEVGEGTLCRQAVDAAAALRMFPRGTRIRRVW